MAAALAARGVAPAVSGGAVRAERRDRLVARSASGACSSRACGSVGSYVAELLARSGVGRLALVDPEPVEPANLARTVYDAEDVGRPKVEALARRLRAIRPGIALDLHARAVEAFEPAALDALVRAADLVVAATDDPGAQRALGRFAYARGRPALHAGLYARAHGGEVILSAPERTPCYLCATRRAPRVGAAPCARWTTAPGRLAAASPPSPPTCSTSRPPP